MYACVDGEEDLSTYDIQQNVYPSCTELELEDNQHVDAYKVQLAWKKEGDQ